MQTKLKNAEMIQKQIMQFKTNYRNLDIAHEKAFIFVLLEQFAGAAHQLEKLAEENQISPLELTLDELINSSIRATKH